jgi:Thioesterase superfamily
MGMAFASTLASQESFTTVELKINFFRPVWEAHLKAEGHAVQRGWNLGYTECEITVLKGEDAIGVRCAVSEFRALIRPRSKQSSGSGFAQEDCNDCFQPDRESNGTWVRMAERSIAQITGPSQTRHHLRGGFRAAVRGVSCGE